MKSFKYILLLSAILLLISNFANYAQEQPSICFTFDDGNPKDVLDYNYLKWDRMILDHLKANKLQAIIYIGGRSNNTPEGRNIMESWDNDGHIIANHTYSHYSYNDENYTFEELKNDILRCDTLIHSYKNYGKYFRAPFLKYGNTRDKRDSLNSFLKRIGYKNGYVTIDNNEWLVNVRLIKFLENNPGKSIDQYKNFYIEHMLGMAGFYDSLAFNVTGRKVKHSILLHHNLISALFLGDLIKAFKDKGWKVINAGEALTDEVYKKIPDIVPAGNSIIWGLAKETGKYEDVLRYQGENSKYDKEKMDKLGL